MAVSPDNPMLSGQPGAQPQGQAPAPVEGQQPALPDGSAPPAPQTVADVEAMWQNRFSQRDRAHNAEVESLRAQLAEAQRSAPAPSGDGSAPASPDSYKARYEASQQELEQWKRNATVSERRARYPQLAGEVAATDPVWAQANDEALARLNALVGRPAAPPPSGPVDANQPSRAPTGVAKPLDQMSQQELLQELARLSPAEEARWRELQGGG